MPTALATPKQVHWLWRLLVTAGREQSVEWACEQLQTPSAKIGRQIAALQQWLDNNHAQHPSEPDHYHPAPANPALMEVLERVAKTGAVPTNVSLLKPNPETRSTRVAAGHYVPSPEEVEAARGPGGGHDRRTLAHWGVAWPPYRGWKKDLQVLWEYEQRNRPMALEEMD